MSNGGKQLRKLLKERGFNVSAVIKALDIKQSTFYGWEDNAPIRELLRISDFTHIPITDIADCYRPAPGAIDPDPAGGDEN